jgi:DNA-nicking Smr family endonuclease
MKKNNKGKKKFIDLDEYIKIQNNESCSKQSNKEKEKNISNNNSNNNKQKLTFKNCLENLVFLFPNFSRDLIEDIYQENNENFSHTKDKLRELSELEMNENKINENKMQIEEEPQKEKKKKKKKYIDISEKTKFEIVDKNDPIDDDNDNIHYMTDSEDEKENKKNNKNENIDYNKLIALKEKSGKEYLSKFDEDNFNFNNNIIINNNSLLKDEPMIDDYLFEQNINFLSDCFPLYKKEQIIQKICENNFDINGVVSNILNETYKNITKDGDNIKNLESKDIEEILTNFEKNENDIDDDFLEIQKAIEHSIKTENNNKKNNIYDKEDFDMNKKENEIEENEEFFLNKNIDDIETPQIKNDLKKLVSQFPLEDVYNIKLVYYSYMDYKSTFEHFDNKDGTKNLKLKTLLNSISNKNYKEYNNTIKKIKKNNKLKTDVEKRRYDTLKKILENKPINWKFEEDKNINEKDFITIRNRLYREAKNFFACGKYKEGQLLLSRAKRYQQEIEQIAKNRGIKQFFNNNSYNNNSKEIDLHGLTVEESKLIINKKIEQLREKKDELNSKSISLTIITGTGSHSQGNRPVLFPKLKEWLKNKKKIRVEGSQEEGALFVTIF